MAALGESDLMKILGPDFRQRIEAANLASGVQDAARAKMAEIASLDGKRTLGIYAILLGLALIVASYLSVTGSTLIFQTAAGAAISIVGLIIFAISSRKIAARRAELAALS